MDARPDPTRATEVLGVVYLRHNGKTLEGDCFDKELPPEVVYRLPRRGKVRRLPGGRVERR